MTFTTCIAGQIDALAELQIFPERDTTENESVRAPQPAPPTEGL